jgi:anti-sigma regulatory factor (Ser/Thr protein kinase)
MSAAEGTANGEPAPAGSTASETPLARLGEVALPANDHAAGAARVVIDHCLSGLAARRVVDEAKLLGSELVTNSLQHGDLRDDDPVLLRIDVGAELLRVEVENPGTVGTVRTRPVDTGGGGGLGLQLVEQLAARWGVRRTHSTTVWFESARV